MAADDPNRSGLFRGQDDLPAEVADADRRFMECLSGFEFLEPDELTDRISDALMYAAERLEIREPYATRTVQALREAATHFSLMEVEVKF